MRANHKGAGYEPGYFLAHAECVRETREISQGAAVTAKNGSKYVPMGSVWPANDATAVGIVYEDVDVTSGDMPGSVVTSGTVIEDRLAITNVKYNAVTPEEDDVPKDKGWYEKVGGALGGDEYVLTDDKAVVEGKTYYSADITRMSQAAKGALGAKGFKFVPSVPDITRPY